MNRSLRRTAVVLLLWSSWVVAQDQEAELEQALQLHQDGEWEMAVQELEGLLATDQLSQGQRKRARQTLAEAYIFLKQEAEAVRVYKQLVRDDRSFDMRSLGENPEARLLRPFGQAVLEVRDEELKALEAQYSQVSRGAVFLRSALVPGWGQRYQGYRWRGYVILGVAASSVTYAVVAERAFRRARDDYQGARADADFETLYDTYTRKADLADLALGIAGAIWATNVLDAVFQRPAIPRAPVSLELQAPPGSAGLQVALLKRF